MKILVKTILVEILIKYEIKENEQILEFENDLEEFDLNDEVKN